MKRIINSTIITGFPHFFAKHLFLYSLCPLTRLFKSPKPAGRKQSFTDTSCQPSWAHSPGPGLRSRPPVCMAGERVGSSAPAADASLRCSPAGEPRGTQRSLLSFRLSPGRPPQSDQGGVPCTGLSLKSISVTMRTLTLNSNPGSQMTQPGPGLMKEL